MGVRGKGERGMVQGRRGVSKGWGRGWQGEGGKRDLGRGDGGLVKEWIKDGG